MAEEQWRTRIVNHTDVDPKKLIPNPNNYREHPDYQKAVMSGVFDELGWIQTVIVNKNTGNIVDGHLRVYLAIEHEEHTVPVTYIDISEEEERKALLTINPIGTLASENAERLRETLKNVSVTDKYVDDIIGRVAKRNKVEYGEVAEHDDEYFDQDNQGVDVTGLEENTVKNGDIWKITDNMFVSCADSTDKKVLKELMDVSGIQTYQGIFTSPPYAEQRKKQYGGIPENKYINWFIGALDNYLGFLDKKGSFFLNIKPHCNADGQRSLYVMKLVEKMVDELGWMLIDEFCWVKTAVPKQVTKHFKNAFEPVYQFTRQADFYFYPDAVKTASNAVPTPGGVGTGATTWSGLQGSGKSAIPMDRKGVEAGLAFPSNVIHTTPKGSVGHEAAFPVALPDFFIRAFSDIDHVWLDPFSGSGTTGVAALSNKRGCLMIEKEPRYVAMTLNRFHETFGIPAQKVK